MFTKAPELVNVRFTRVRCLRGESTDKITRLISSMFCSKAVAIVIILHYIVGTFL